MSFQISRQGSQAITGEAFRDVRTAEAVRRPMSRISMSLPENLLSSVDRLVARRRFPSRSHAISMVLRQYMSGHPPCNSDEILIATITMVYTERYDVHRELCELRQRYRGEIVSRTALQLEGDQTLDVMLVRGTAGRLTDLQSEVERMRGVVFGKAHLISVPAEPVAEES